MVLVIRMHSSKGRWWQILVSFLHAEIEKYEVAVSPIRDTNNLLSNRVSNSMHCVARQVQESSDSSTCAEL